MRTKTSDGGKSARLFNLNEAYGYRVTHEQMQQNQRWITLCGRK